jgi:hypothetical protein
VRVGLPIGRQAVTFRIIRRNVSTVFGVVAVVADPEWKDLLLASRRRLISQINDLGLRSHSGCRSAKSCKIDGIRQISLKFSATKFSKLQLELAADKRSDR